MESEVYEYEKSIFMRFFLQKTLFPHVQQSQLKMHMLSFFLSALISS